MVSTNSRLAFALEILKRLAEKPYKRRDLANELEIFLQQRGEKPGDVLQKLDRTIAKLRDCGFEIDSTSHSPYVLRESNFPLILSPQQRQALGMAVQFLENMGFSAEAGHLLRLGKFPDIDRLSPVNVDFSPPVDYSEHRIPGIVEALQQRFDRQCRYTIRYCNSKQEERLWDLDRSELRLHEGTLYLFAYVPNLNSYNIPKRPNAEQNMLFRVDRILNVGPASQTRWLLVESGFPTLSVRYRMVGALANYQPRRDRERVLDRNFKLRYVEIETEEDCLFWFQKRMLRYCPNAVVIEPSWLARKMLEMVDGAGSLYAQTLRL